MSYLYRTVQYELYDDGSNLNAEIIVKKLLPLMEDIRAATDTVGE